MNDAIERLIRELEEERREYNKAVTRAIAALRDEDGSRPYRGGAAEAREIVCMAEGPIHVDDIIRKMHGRPNKASVMVALDRAVRTGQIQKVAPATYSCFEKP